VLKFYQNDVVCRFKGQGLLALLSTLPSWRGDMTFAMYPFQDQPSHCLSRSTLRRCTLHWSREGLCVCKVSVHGGRRCAKSVLHRLRDNKNMRCIAMHVGVSQTW